MGKRESDSEHLPAGSYRASGAGWRLPTERVAAGVAESCAAAAEGRAGKLMLWVRRGGQAPLFPAARPGGGRWVGR